MASDQAASGSGALPHEDRTAAGLTAEVHSRLGKAAVAHNLPLQLTSFVGRKRETAQICALLDRNRLVTLTGTGGVGKTRLGLEVAGQLTARYRDGVWLVELAGLSDAALVPQSVAKVLGLREEAGCDIEQQVSKYLQTRHVLLLVDNCEHLVAACASLVDALLRHCPGLSVLATSREALNVPGEIAWLVPSLSAADEAVHLFLDRASAAKPNSETTDWPPSTVEDICRRLDGIPLAIELAATRVKTLTAEEILERLDDRFRLLSSGPRTAMPRHQTLRAMVDWSYELLSDRERCLFRRASVFAGGWTLEAAEAVCSGGIIERRDVVALIAQLVDKSVVVLDRVDGRYRNRLLETLRQYAAEALQDSGEAEVVHHRHLEYFHALVQQTHSDSARLSREGMTRISADFDNVRAALNWSANGGSIVLGLDLAGLLQPFWWVAGNATEGRARLAGLLDRALHSDDTSDYKAARTRALIATGFLACVQGDLDTAGDALQAAHTLSREVADSRQLALCLRWLGRLAILQEKPEHGRPYLEESLRLARDSGYPTATYEALHGLGMIASQQADTEQARALFEQAFALEKAHGDVVQMHLSAVNLGALAAERGDSVGARHWLTVSLQEAQKNGGGVAPILDSFAYLAAIEGQAERALRLAGAAAGLRQYPGAALPPRMQALIRTRVEAARRMLDEETAAAAWREGQLTDLQAAVACALDVEIPARGRSAELTPRECEVAILLAHGLTNPQIADRLIISRGTVKRHIENILTRLDLTSRSQISSWATTRYHIGHRVVDA